MVIIAASKALTLLMLQSVPFKNYCFMNRLIIFVFQTGNNVRLLEIKKTAAMISSRLSDAI